MSEMSQASNPMLGIGEVMREIADREVLIDAATLRERLNPHYEYAVNAGLGDGAVSTFYRGYAEGVDLALSIMDELGAKPIR